MAKAKIKIPENRERTGKVGRGRPPAHTRWKPGQSGNPGGRPKTAHLAQAYREALESLDPKTQRSVAEVIAMAIIRRALKGDVKAAQEIADRTEGKARQAIEITQVGDPYADKTNAELVEFIKTGQWPNVRFSGKGKAN